MKRRGLRWKIWTNVSNKYKESELRKKQYLKKNNIEEGQSKDIEEKPQMMLRNHPKSVAGREGKEEK